MNKVKHLLHAKFLFASMLSRGVLLLGIAYISWSIMNIGAQSVHYTENYVRAAYPKPSPDPIILTVKQVRSAEDYISAKESTGISSPILNSDEILYPAYPVEGDNIGSLSIPVLKQKLPIFQGTGSKELKKGVGHFIQSVLPGEADNCVLSGHRDTVFAKLGKLKVGDQLITETSAGIFTYEIKLIRIVDKDDKTVIVPTDHAVLTLTTCFPFRFIGNAPYRYIIVSDLVMN